MVVAFTVVLLVQVASARGEAFVFVVVRRDDRAAGRGVAAGSVPDRRRGRGRPRGVVDGRRLRRGGCPAIGAIT
jgi:hypothetical protein